MGITKPHFKRHTAPSGISGTRRVPEGFQRAEIEFFRGLGLCLVPILSEPRSLENQRSGREGSMQRREAGPEPRAAGVACEHGEDPPFA